MPVQVFDKTNSFIFIFFQETLIAAIFCTLYPPSIHPSILSLHTYYSLNNPPGLCPSSEVKWEPLLMIRIIVEERLHIYLGSKLHAILHIPKI